MPMRKTMGTKRIEVVTQCAKSSYVSSHSFQAEDGKLCFTSAHDVDGILPSKHVRNRESTVVAGSNKFFLECSDMKSVECTARAHPLAPGTEIPKPPNGLKSDISLGKIQHH